MDTADMAYYAWLIVGVFGVAGGLTVLGYELIRGRKVISRDKWEIVSSLFFTVFMLAGLFTLYLRAGLTAGFIIGVLFFFAGMVMVFQAAKKAIEST